MVIGEAKPISHELLLNENPSSRWTNAIVYEAYPQPEINGVSYLQRLTTLLNENYFESLHVKAIYLPPIYEDANGGFDWHYDVADHTKISSKFGTIEQFKGLVGEAKTHGIDVIMDFVANHASVFDKDYLEAISTPDNEKQEMFLFHEDTLDGHPPSQQKNAFGIQGWQKVEWTREDGSLIKRKWVWTSFSEGQRDYNWASQSVQDKMHAIIDFWKNLGVKGFRGDALPFIKHYKGEIPAEITLLNGEYVMKHTREISRWIGSEGILIPEASIDDALALVKQKYGSSIPRFCTREDVAKVLEAMSAYHMPREQGMSAIAPVDFLPYYIDWVAKYMKMLFNTRRSHIASLQDALFTSLISDHDTNGHAHSRLEGYLARQAQIEAFRAPVTILFNGDEIGQQDGIPLGNDIYNRDRARHPTDYNEALRQREEPNSQFTFTASLGRIREEYPAFLKGRYQTLELGEKVYGYILRHPSGNMLIIHSSCTDEEGIDISLSDFPFAEDGQRGNIVLSTYMDRSENIALNSIHLRPSESMIIAL